MQGLLLPAVWQAPWADSGALLAILSQPHKSLHSRRGKHQRSRSLGDARQLNYATQIAD
jgi:hypothetical protein